MRDKHIFVALEVEGAVDVHGPSIDGNYATLCGLDGDDPSIQQSAAALPKKPKITCRGCWAIYVTAHRLRETDFSPEIRKLPA